MPCPSGSRPSRIATSGTQLEDLRDRLGDGPGLADDLQVVLVLEECAQSPPYDGVVVEQVDPDLVAHSAVVPLSEVVVQP